MMDWIELQIRKIRNRIRRFRKSNAWDVFLGVFWALVLFRLLEIAAPLLYG